MGILILIFVIVCVTQAVFFVALFRSGKILVHSRGSIVGLDQSGLPATGPEIGEIPNRELLMPIGLDGLRDFTGSVTADLRCYEISKTHGIQWNEWDWKSRSDSLTGSAVGQYGSNGLFFGPMKMNVDGCEILVTDWMYREPFGNRAYKNMFQTVVVIIPEEMDVPDFYVHPRSYAGLTSNQSNLVALSDMLPMSRYERIETDTPLDSRFHLESLIEYRALNLFQSELGIERLIPFLCQRDWTVEWTGDRMVVFELGKLIPAEEIKDFVLEVTELLYLIREAPEAILQQFKEKHGFA